MAEETLPADPRDGRYDWPEEARVAAVRAIDARTGPHLQITVPMAMYVATDILDAAAPLIRAGERDRTVAELKRRASRAVPGIVRDAWLGAVDVVLAQERDDEKGGQP